MIKFTLILLLISWGSFSYSVSLFHNINAFKNTKYININNLQQCPSIIGQAWQCWGRFGNNPMCSNIIHQAWQCSGQGSMLQALLDIETVFPQEQGSMQTITIGEDKKVIAVMIPEVFINHCLQFNWPLYRLTLLRRVSKNRTNIFF